MTHHTLSNALALLGQTHALRKRHTRGLSQGASFVLDGATYDNFGSNDYLGLSHHPKLIAAAQQACAQYGVGSGASALVTGYHAEHQALEEELAAWTGRPRALLCSTGYMANLAAILALTDHRDRVLVDRLSHASLLDACQLSGLRWQRYRHLDVTHLDTLLTKTDESPAIVATDAVFSMDGDIAPVAALADVCQQQRAWLLVDDAHGLGVLGETGGGVLETLKLNHQQVPLLVGTFGKALGTFGAFIAGEDVFIETILQQARSVIYTTALPPAIAAATRASLRLVQEETWRREHLQTLISYFRKLAHEAKLPLLPSTTPIQPLLVESNEAAIELSETLRQHQLWAPAIRPPTVPKNQARLRISLRADHSKEQLERLVEAITTFKTYS